MFSARTRIATYWYALSVAALLAPLAAADAAPISLDAPYVSFGAEMAAGALDTGHVNTGAILSGSYTRSVSLLDSGAAATLDASVTHGRMRLFSQAATLPGYDGISTRGPQVNVDLQYGDTLLPASATMATGTLVPFEFTLSLQYLAVAGPATHALNYGSVGIWVSNAWPNEWPCPSFAGPIGQCEPTGRLQWSLGDGSASDGLLSFVLRADLPVGVTSYFVQHLWARNFQTQVAYGEPIGINTIDGLAWLEIASLNPDVSFTTGTGYGYSGEPTETAPVPEPATMMLFGSGLAGIAARLRRGRPEGRRHSLG